MNEWKRLQESLGWVRFLLVVLSIAALAMFAALGLPVGLLQVAPLAIMPAVALLTAGARWGSYQSSRKIIASEAALPGILASPDEYCLLLRPFGADGEILLQSDLALPRSGAALSTASVTLEQAVAAAVRRQLGISTIALVDQNRKLAPPGPIYLRAAHDRWKATASDLIARAHTVAIVLPPGQVLRDALEWELGEIVRTQRTGRVVIVLPPPELCGPDHERMAQLATMLVTALRQGVATSAVEAHQLDTGLMDASRRAVLFKVSAPDDPSVARYWAPAPDPSRRPRKLGAAAYVAWMSLAVEAVEAELQAVPFRARYARPATGPLGRERSLPSGVGSGGELVWNEPARDPQDQEAEPISLRELDRESRSRAANLFGLPGLLLAVLLVLVVVVAVRAGGGSSPPADPYPPVPSPAPWTPGAP